MKKNLLAKYAQPKTEYYELVKAILEHPEFIKRKTYAHHENCSVYEHSLIVSILVYKWAKKWHCDYKSAAIGGLLHDFYDKPWQMKSDNDTKKEKIKFFKQHGFIHASQATKNAYYYFPKMMNKKIENMIKRHMFPLNICPPRYKESWMVTIIDKYVSMDILKTPKAWPKYLGLAKKEKK